MQQSTRNMSLIVFIWHFWWNEFTTQVQTLSFQDKRYISLLCQTSLKMASYTMMSMRTHPLEVSQSSQIFEATSHEFESIAGHDHVVADHLQRMLCAVCKLEEWWMESCNFRQAYREGSRQQYHMSICSTNGIPAHFLPVSWNQKIFWNWCFHREVLFPYHSYYLLCRTVIPRNGVNKLTLRKSKTVKKQRYIVSTSHPIYRNLMKEYTLWGQNLFGKG